MTFDLRPEAQERHRNQRDESLRSGGRVFQAGGTVKTKAQSAHEFDILKTAKKSEWLDNVNKGERGGGWWWWEWGLDHVGPCGPW